MLYTKPKAFYPSKAGTIESYHLWAAYTCVRIYENETERSVAENRHLAPQKLEPPTTVLTAHTRVFWMTTMIKASWQLHGAKRAAAAVVVAAAAAAAVDVVVAAAAAVDVAAAAAAAAAAANLES